MTRQPRHAARRSVELSAAAIAALLLGLFCGVLVPVAWLAAQLVDVTARLH
jgi:hypothetical protein